MKTYVGLVALFVAFMLVIPAFSLLGKDAEASDVVMTNAPAGQTSQPGGAQKPQSPASTAKANTQPAVVQKANDHYFKLLDQKTGKVIELSAADYVKGVVAAEMPAEFHVEALKAQAVASHTYALRLAAIQEKNPDPTLKGAHFSNDPASYQSYLSPDEAKAHFGNKYNTYWKKISDAVDAVIDQAIVYQDEPIVAAFHSISGGTTETAQNVWGGNLSYLKPVDSAGDKLSPNYEATVTLTAKAVSETLQKQVEGIELPADKSKWFADIVRTSSGTVTTVKIGEKSFTGLALRGWLDLRSANFTVNYDKEKDSFTFTTKGYGHGVGMSQYGADYLARQGQKYDQILKHYYSGVELTDI